MLGQLTIEYINQSHILVDCDDADIIDGIERTFSYLSPGYKYSPQYQAGVWDGRINLYKRGSSTTRYGLIKPLVNWCRGHKVMPKLSPRIIKDFKTAPIDIDGYIDKYILPFEPMEHQMLLINELIRNKHGLYLSATSSGKSFSLYISARILLDSGAIKKLLIVVPTVDLVTQLAEDFRIYSENDDSFHVKDSIHSITAGKKKTTKLPIIISTWHSIAKLPDPWFKKFQGVFIDECHLASGASLIRILDNSVNSIYRAGVTGTIRDAKTHELVLTSIFGPVKHIISTAELIELGLATKLLVNVVEFTYPKAVRETVNEYEYREELNFIIQNEERNRWIAEFVDGLKGTSLVLYAYIELQGKPLYELIKQYTNRRVYYIDGKVKKEKVNEIKELAETENDVIIIASYKKFSTGISIKRLRNIVFASPMKSKITILQSIGRILRLNKYFSDCFVYDLADDLRGDGRTNTTYKHLLVRLGLYSRAEFPVIREIKIKLT